jgi:hypothetical protein
MAFQTGPKRLRWSEIRERADGGFAAAGGNVIAARAMAPFATGMGGRFFARRDGFVMRIFLEILPHIGMASLTGFAADVVVSGSGWPARRTLSRQSHWQYKNCDPFQHSLAKPTLLNHRKSGCKRVVNYLCMNLR